MRNRLELQKTLEDIPGVRGVYFQPPASNLMRYPAIVYSRSGIRNYYADNEVYRQGSLYEIVVIDKNPDSDIVKTVSLLPRCKFIKHYVADNHNHDVFEIYF